MKLAGLYTFFLALTGLTFWTASTKAQTCKGALGDPVVNFDFGRGNASRGPGLGSATGYNYTTGRIDDGSYTIAKSTAGMNSGWYTLLNHTPDEPDGYMMVVNAQYDPGIFYESDVDIPLCPNTTYEFAAWVANLLRYSGVKPNITFMILDENGLELAAYHTGDIPDENQNWKQYGFLFTTSNVDRVKIRMINNVRNSTGAGGNDIALDDITFRACGPEVTATVNGQPQQVKDICKGDAEHYDFSAIVSPGVYSTPEFLWQRKEDDGAWLDLPTEKTQYLSVDFDNAIEGIYQYRLLVAESGNINGPCRTASAAFVIRVNAPPEVRISTPATVCQGFPIHLSVNAASSYLWTGPNNFTSTERAPVIPSASPEMEGLYTVWLTNAANCSSSATLDLKIVAPTSASIEAIAPICEGSSIRLQASGGPIYRWSPAAGLSATNIANPIARPDKSTRYTVTVSNGSCETTAEVEVEVVRKAIVDAGPDKKIAEDEHVVLSPQVNGDIGSIRWSPAEGLSDPNVLNPIASPKKDMTYTLTISSACGVVSDQVFVRVYQHIKIPNAFSPNGDGTNDTWEIDAINTYVQPRITVVDRYGDVVFESRGYDKPWDGKRQNKELPTGVYYYVIQLTEDLKARSGAVTILR